MQGREHFAFGIAATGAVLWGVHALGLPLDLGPVVAGGVVAGVGSLAPDIDQPQSMISNRIPFTMLSLGLLLAGGPGLVRLAADRGGMFAATFIGLSDMASPLIPWGFLLIVLAAMLIIASLAVRKEFKHRGGMHSLTLAGAGAVLGMVICAAVKEPVWVGLLFGLGWASHVVADATTPNGLGEVFWPFEAHGAVLGRGLAAALLVLVIVLGLLGWWQSAGSIRGSISHSPTAASVTGDVPLARQRLAEASPEIEASLVKPDEPTIAVSGANTAYTWDRLQKTTDGAVLVKTITVTLDSAGNVVGVDEH